ncbi:hypothetical protein VTH82DRAFT_2618 [Thermothelomyces myriococcoides]
MEGQSLNQSSQPALLLKVQREYGRRDYNRFDNIASTHARVGHGTIGKIEVDCRFLFTKSQWGVIGKDKKPAGIIYLDLVFIQPVDCRLKAATVTVTLAGDDGKEAQIQLRYPCLLQFTHYGPKHIRGPEVPVETRKVSNFTPEVRVLGHGAGGLGVNYEKFVKTAGWWVFSGITSSTKGNDFRDDCLRWELKENLLEWQPTHKDIFHTAFALKHNATRFYMTIQVSGKLARVSDRIMNRLKFGRGSNKDEERVTKIEWTGEYKCSLPLDEVAEGLDMAMVHANTSDVSETRPDSSSRTEQVDDSSSEPLSKLRPPNDAGAGAASGPDLVMKSLRLAHHSSADDSDMDGWRVVTEYG